MALPQAFADPKLALRVCNWPAQMTQLHVPRFGVVRLRRFEHSSGKIKSEPADVCNLFGKRHIDDLLFGERRDLTMKFVAYRRRNNGNEIYKSLFLLPKQCLTRYKLNSGYICRARLNRRMLL